MTAAPDLPSDEDALLLHARLTRGEPTAPSVLAVAYLDHLIDWLSRHNRSADPDFCAEAADEAIVALIKNPASYSPSRSTLAAYLRMSAQGDLRNILAREGRHWAGRRPLDGVELSPHAGKYLAEGDDPSLPVLLEEAAEAARSAIPPTFLESLNEGERRVFDLMAQAERRTSAYAAALGIDHLPAEQQRAEVKRVRDRLEKRLDRAVGSKHDEQGP
ncbi:MAG: hypothetical protein U0840_31275 [Gemmataceae bacterium]